MSGMGKRKTVRIERPADVADWGEKHDRGNADYQRPFKVAGETVDLDRLPQLGSRQRAPADGGARRLPLLPPGSP